MSINWWTLALQAINVLILVWLLQLVFWRPVAGMIAKRRAEAQALIDDSTAKNTKAERALAEIERTRAGFSDERAAILVQARTDAEAATKAATAKAEAAAKNALDAAEATRARAAAEADKSRDNAAADLAIDIARRLVGRVDGALVQEAFLAWMFDQIPELDADTRQAIADGSEALELVTPVPLDKAAQARVQSEMTAAVGGTPKLTFKSDPQLLAGAELRGAHVILRNSWQADLAHIAEELAHAG